MPRRRPQAVLECARGVMTAAAAGLFAQHLPDIYQRAALHLGACSGPLPAQSAGEYRRWGQGASSSLLALERTLIHF